MRYYGSKGLFGKQIANAMMKYITKHNFNSKKLILIEPFCGILSVTKYIHTFFDYCYLNDQNQDIILLLKEISKGSYKKPSITKDSWKQLKNSNEPSADRAFAAFAMSWGGIPFNGYLGAKCNVDQQYNTLLSENYRELNENSELAFSSKDYIDFMKNFEFNTTDSNEEYIVYLDPPYYNTSHVREWNIDYGEFITLIAYLKTYKNITIFISENDVSYIPYETKMIYHKHKKNRINGKEFNEKLFVIL